MRHVIKGEKSNTYLKTYYLSGIKSAKYKYTEIILKRTKEKY